MKTPQKNYPKLAQALGLKEVWLKREDLHPYGSHKGRSIPLLVKEYAKQGITHFVISSSGNAALAALRAVQKHNQNNPNHPVRLTIFIGPNIAPEKQQRLQNEITDPTSISIQSVPNPKQSAFLEGKHETTQNLRQSTDDLALRGYFELADDLSKIPNLAAVFIPTSSGTTAQGIGEASIKKGLPFEVHIVQTSTCHPIAKDFDLQIPPVEKTSLASAIVDHIAHRKKAVSEIIRSTKGSGWIVSNEEIETAQKLLEEHTGLTVSNNSALSLAGLLKAQKQGKTWNGPIALLITGA